MTTASRPPAVRTQLAIEGMTCGNCVHHVEQALGAIAGVRGEVDLAAGTAVVDHPPSVTVQELLAAIDDAGYDATVAGPA